MLNHLIYASRLKLHLTSESLRRLVEQSATNNALRGVTGVLMVHGHSTMQLLEGEAHEIEALFTKIAADARHKDVVVLLRKAVDKRLYPEWGMGLANLRSPLELDRARMIRMLDDVRSTTNTQAFSVETRILIRDFEHQARLAA